MNQNEAGRASSPVLPTLLGVLGTVISTSALDFSNTNSLILPAFHAGPGAASLYPSTIDVSGLTGKVARVSVTLHDISIDRPDDLELLLAAPDGASLVILGDAGGISPVESVTVTLDDLAESAVPDAGPMTTGVYRATSINSSATTFPLPAPQSGYSQAEPGGSSTFASVFNGLDPNGTWSLYAVDDVSSGTGGMIAGGWSLSLLTSPPFNLLSAGMTNGNPSLQFTGFTGQSYYFQRATNVAGPYVDLSPVLIGGPDGVIELEDSETPTTPERYYRVRPAP